MCRFLFFGDSEAQCSLFFPPPSLCGVWHPSFLPQGVSFFWFFFFFFFFCFFFFFLLFTRQIASSPDPTPLPPSFTESCSFPKKMIRDPPFSLCNHCRSSLLERLCPRNDPFFSPLRPASSLPPSLLMATSLITSFSPFIWKYSLPFPSDCSD